MIIGIDVSTVPYGTGVSNYTLNLVKNLIKIDKINTYKLFYSSFRLPLPPEIQELQQDHVKIYQFRLPPTLLQILWNQLHLFPIEMFIGPCNIFHTSDWTQAPTLKAKTITTIHDLTPFLFPQWHHPKVIQAHKNKMRRAVKSCSHFICVSQNTKTDLLKLFPKISPEKISVIYEAAEDKYSKFCKLTPALRQQKINNFKRQYGLDKFILAQGTREPRKNLNRLIEAFKIFKSKHPKNSIELAIAGKFGWGKDITSSADNSIKILGFIPEKDMVSLHASAFCLAYPSLYEGFGLPLIKSMKVGVPIITSNNSSLAEISQKSAILVNPLSVENITKALIKITNSALLRKKLSEAGITRSKTFSWAKTAKETLAIYAKTLC